jgi:hypothetical protein
LRRSIVGEHRPIDVAIMRFLKDASLDPPSKNPGNAHFEIRVVRGDSADRIDRIGDDDRSEVGTIEPPEREVHLRMVPDVLQWRKYSDVLACVAHQCPLRNE